MRLIKLVQIIEGTTSKPEALYAAGDAWQEEVQPGAIGYLGVRVNRYLETLNPWPAARRQGGEPTAAPSARTGDSSDMPPV